MRSEDYPAIYRAADIASNRSQRRFLLLTKLQFAVLIVGAALGTVGVHSTASAVAAAFVFIGGICLSALLAFSEYEEKWYRCRAISESVKTTTWRFMMKAEPYQEPDDSKALADFTAALSKILREHKNLGAELAGKLAGEPQITDTMRNARARTLEARRSMYVLERIDDQKSWYADKSDYNSRHANAWIGALIILQASAVALVILRITQPSFQYWPVEVLAVAAAVALSWLQTKRFRELAAAYALSAHEIGLIKTEVEAQRSDDAFSKFVADAENAFSREHTQWIARKDVAP